MKERAAVKKYKSQSRNRRVGLGVTYTLLTVLGIVWLIFVAGICGAWLIVRPRRPRNSGK